MDDAILGVAKEKLKHPFWAGFVLSWSFLNWKVFIDCIFNSELITTKYFEDNLVAYYDWWLLIPILIGFLNVILFPAITNNFDEFAKVIHSIINRFFNKIRDSKVYSQKDIDKLESKYSKEIDMLKSSGVDIINKKNELDKLNANFASEIDQLNYTVKVFRTKIDSSKNLIEKINKKTNLEKITNPHNIMLKASDIQTEINELKHILEDSDLKIMVKK